MDDILLKILRENWGYDDFRPMQREIIESVLQGRDTLALLPTGGGKSITYQLPTLMGDGVCIVVTPLIALMKDQVDTLRKQGIPAAAVHSGLNRRQIDIILDNCVYGDIKFLYIAPERLSSEVFRMRVDRMNVTLLAVDEAHCISQWGHDFRPSYLKIAEIRRFIPNAPILALTASATKQVADDIMYNLAFSEKHILQGSFLRPNLSYSIRHTEDKNEQLMRIVNNVEGSGIVYTRTRNGAEEVSKFLIENGVSASFYHGGLTHFERTERQDEWISDKIRIMVATNAFGMGIDKKDVRFVVHYSLCDSLEAYYQEAGRAGRDGKRSYAVLMKSNNDDLRIATNFDNEFPPLEIVRTIYNQLCSDFGVAIGDGCDYSFQFNIYNFCSRMRLPLTTVLNSLKLLQLNGYMTYIEDNESPARLMFMVTRDELYGVPMHSKAEEDILRTILRLYTGVFSEFRNINEMEIADASHHSYSEVHETLKRLWRAKVIRYIPSNHSPVITLTEERLPKRDVYIAPETYAIRKSLMLERYENMVSYTNSEDECRSQLIERYFCNTVSEPCGICDNCLARKRSTPSLNRTQEIEKQVLHCAEKGLTIEKCIEEIRGDRDIIISCIDKLLESDKIAITEVDGTLHRADK